MSHKKVNRKSKWIVGCILVFLVLFFIFLRWEAYDFLCYSRSTSPDIMVVEGWLPEDALEDAKNEFIRGNYKILITTGFPFNNGYLVGSGGTVEFGRNTPFPPGRNKLYNISVTTKGTKANGIYPHMVLYADSVQVGDLYTTNYKKEVNFQIKLDSCPKTIRVIFDNDANYRDLTLYSISVNGKTYEANNNQVAFYDNRYGSYQLLKYFSRSSSEGAANFFKHAGIPDSLIKEIETINIDRSRTYSTALDIKKWLSIVSPSTGRSITIYSQGIHARRTYISFKKAFHKEVNLGIICAVNTRINKLNWWRSIQGWGKMIREISGVIYVSCFL